MDPAHLLTELDAQLIAQADPARAAQERAYLKSARRFLGVPMPALRTLVRRLDDLVPRAATLEVAATFWDDTHEHVTLAVLLLERRAPHLGLDALPTLEGLLRASGTWAYVDAMAVHVIGALHLRLGAADTLDRWALDPDFWIRRSALLASIAVLRAPRGDRLAELAAFERRAAPQLADPEFFLRKAIGWVLREAASREPAAVEAFVDRHGPAMAGLTFREATRKLPAEAQARLQPRAPTQRRR